MLAICFQMYQLYCITTTPFTSFYWMLAIEKAIILHGVQYFNSKLVAQQFLVSGMGYRWIFFPVEILLKILFACTSRAVTFSRTKYFRAPNLCKFCLNFNTWVQIYTRFLRKWQLTFQISLTGYQTKYPASIWKTGIISQHRKGTRIRRSPKETSWGNEKLCEPILDTPNRQLLRSTIGLWELFDINLTQMEVGTFHICAK